MITVTEMAEQQGTNVNASNGMVTPSDKLRAVQEAAHSADFSTADNLLLSIETEASDDRRLQLEYNRVVNEVARLKQQRATDLRKELSDLFNSGNIDQLAASERLEQLAPLDPDRADHFQQRLADHLAEEQERQRYEEVFAECKVLWRQVDELVERGVDYEEILTRTYKRAVQIAEQAAATSSGLAGLVRDARRRLEEASNRFQVLSTAAELGAFRDMLDVLDREPDDKPIQLFGPGNKDLGMMLARDARAEVIKMAEEFAYRKAESYWEAAKLHMEAHVPAAADKTLARADELYALDEITRERLRIYREEEVKPQLTAFQEAQRLLNQARRTIDANSSWELTEQAIATYGWLLEADAVRFNLLPQLVKQIEQKTALVESQLAGADARQRVSADWETHKSDLTQQQQQLTQLDTYIQQTQRTAQELSEQAQTALAEAETARQATDKPESDPIVEARTTLADFYDARAQRANERSTVGLDLQTQLQDLTQRLTTAIEQTTTLTNLQIDLRTATTELRNLMNTDLVAAGQRWQALQQQFEAETLQAYAPLNQLVLALNAQLDVEQLLAQLEQDARSDDLERIAQALLACQEATDNRANITFADRLADVRQRLELRRDFLQGRSALQMGDAQKALALLEKITSGPDAGRARKLVNSIQDQLSQEEEISDALRDARKWLARQPQKAHDRLRPFAETLSRFHDDILELLERSYNEWQAQNRTAIEALLNQKLSVRSIKELRELEETRRTELGIDDALNQRALGASFAYEAERAVGKYQWQSAAEKWAEAFSADPDEKYEQAQRHAEKKYAEQLLQNRGADAEPIIRQLLIDMPHDPELNFWIARLYVHQAQDLETPSQAAEQLYFQAAEQLSFAREKLHDVHNLDAATLQSNIQTLQGQIQEGLQIEEVRQKIELRLHPNRSVREFFDTRNEAERLLTDYAHYPPGKPPLLTRWWQQLRTRIIRQLEEIVNGIGADEDWKRFEPLSKILALDEEHHQAVSVLTQIGGMAARLEQDMRGFMADRNGLGTSGEDEIVLERQIDQLNTLQLRGEAMYAMLQRMAARVVNGQTALSSVGDVLADVREQQNTLQQFNQLVARARQLLTTARANGKWDGFAQIMTQIGELGFGSHRTTNFLNGRRNQDTARRQELETLAKTMDGHAREGNFIAALRYADRLRDPNTGDPTDEYSIQRTYIYEDPKTHTLTRHLSRVMHLWQSKVEQLRTISSWLLQSGLSDVVKEHELLVNMGSNPPEIVDWAATASEIDKLRKRGNFRRARDKCLNAIDGDQEMPLINLVIAQQRLRILPVRPVDVESQLGERLLETAATELEKLQDETKAAQVKLSELQRLEQEWEDRWAAFTAANTQLIRARASFWLIGKQERIKSAETSRRATLISCQEICPDHPELQGVS